MLTGCRRSRPGPLREDSQTVPCDAVPSSLNALWNLIDSESSGGDLYPFQPQQPDLDPLRKAHIGKQRKQEDRPVHPWQVGQAQRRGQRRIRQPCSEGHDGECSDQQRPACTALEERDLIGANDMNNERLRHDGLNEPSRLKYRGAGWIPAIEDPEHYEEGRVVEDRTDGSYAENEPPYLADVPGPRPRHLFFVHGVVGNGHLGEVVEHIVCQNLNGRHGKKWEKCARSQHTEHISKVGAGSHPDVLENVGEDLSPLDDAPIQHHEILLQQDQIRRLLGDVGRSIHRDANIRGTQRGRIVDSVPHESNYVPLAAQHANNSLLVGR